MLDYTGYLACEMPHLNDRNPCGGCGYPGIAPDPWLDLGDVRLYHGDCRELLPLLNIEDDAVTITDPPYGDTSLEWDSWVDGWAHLLPPTQAWVFGSMRMWLQHGSAEFHGAGWRLAQGIVHEDDGSESDLEDIVWEKQAGSGFHADRFKRVHEHAVHWYQGQWSDTHHEPVMTHDATARVTRRKQRPPHTGGIGGAEHVSEDGGPRLQRSVIRVRNCHGYAVHPTQKPVGILTPLIEYSTPPGGIVLDPFAGSGSTLVAARMLGRRAVGIEGNIEYLERAAERLAQGSLFASGGAA